MKDISGIKSYKIIYCCEECSNDENIKVRKNLVSKGIWECPKCGHPHSEGDLMEFYA